MKLKPLNLLSACVASLLLAACSTSTDLSTGGAPVESRTPVMVGAQATPAAVGATSSGTTAPRVASSDINTGSAGAGAAALDAASQRVIYFGFDSSEIQDQYKPLIDAQAKALAANPARRIAVEGHTDERGGSEYNLALGQKRAEAVARALELLGVGNQQVEAVSFGAERPTDPGHDEAAWAKNRRAELKDR